MFLKIRDNLIINLDFVKYMNYNESKEEIELRFIDNSSQFYRNIDKNKYKIFLDSLNINYINFSEIDLNDHSLHDSNHSLS